MQRTNALLCLLLLGSACTPKLVRTQKTPAEAITAAERRLDERAITLDPAGKRPDRLRTAHFCYKAPDRAGRHWDRSFTDTRPGPIGFEIEGTLPEQDEARAQCTYLFQAELLAERGAERRSEETSLTVQVSWWRLHNPKCAPIGDPLLGRLRCEYSYRGAKAPDNAEGFFYGLLKGL